MRATARGEPAGHRLAAAAADQEADRPGARGRDHAHHAQHPGVHQGPRQDPGDRRVHRPKGRGENMQTFDQHLLDLLRANKISVETALAAASNPTDFRRSSRSRARPGGQSTTRSRWARSRSSRTSASSRGGGQLLERRIAQTASASWRPVSRPRLRAAWSRAARGRGGGLALVFALAGRRRADDAICACAPPGFAVARRGPQQPPPAA